MKKELIVAKNAGFCFGVTRAVRLAERVLKEKKGLVAFGDLVHNPLVMGELEKSGLKVAGRVQQIKNRPFIIRSHGLPPGFLGKVEKIAACVYDATCPFVKKVQNQVKNLAERGYFIFLVGDSQHPEIKVLKELAGKNSLIVSPEKPEIKPAGKQTAADSWAILAQTTLSSDMYAAALKKILDRPPRNEVIILNTICPVSITRQEETAQIAGRVGILFVIGGKRSSNTRKLLRIGRKFNKNTWQVEKISDLRKINLSGFRKAGVVSGASTDLNFIMKVVGYLQEKGFSVKKNKTGV